jgi:hypothetical protein
MDWMIRFTDTLYTPPETRGSYIAVVKLSKSSLVVSWQRIYTSLTVRGKILKSISFTDLYSKPCRKKVPAKLCQNFPPEYEYLSMLKTESFTSIFATLRFASLTGVDTL